MAASSFHFTAPPPTTFPKNAISQPVILSKPLFLLPSTCNSVKKFICRAPRSVASVHSYDSMDEKVDYFEQEFGGQGVTFERIGMDSIARLMLDNGSTASVLLPSGMITSYKAPMWHGGSLELLHSSVSSSSSQVQGGVSLALNLSPIDDDLVKASLWSPTFWSLHSVTGDLSRSIRVELITSNGSQDNMIQLKYIITLQQDMLSSELIISNFKSTSLSLTGSILTHLTVSSPDATYAVGLEGSSFFSRLPFPTDSLIIPPDFGQDNGFDLGQSLKGLFSGLGSRTLNKVNGEGEEIDEEVEVDETDNYKHLTKQMSQIYLNAPRNFSLIDRGRRNSVEIGRDGFDELYLLSPGSNHEFYGENAYICIGQSAMLNPIILSPHQVWRGGQYLHNPNQ